MFALDYAARVVRASDRRGYVLRHLHDLAVIVLPLLRLITVIGALNRRAGASLRGRVAVYVARSTTLLTVVGALAMRDAKRDAPEANITTIGDAIWSGAAVGSRTSRRSSGSAWAARSGRGGGDRLP
ncbi:hypothetical protein [Modestobacter marinus]|uniref:hypothetical protein n=1 Tax=Modestobacter marinus TaxID=477641 RepID=UPI001C95FCF6|nr:hypothetical protein [Modestobacter marinus]